MCIYIYIYKCIYIHMVTSFATRMSYHVSWGPLRFRRPPRVGGRRQGPCDFDSTCDPLEAPGGLSAKPPTSRCGRVAPLDAAPPAGCPAPRGCPATWGCWAWGCWAGCRPAPWGCWAGWDPPRRSLAGGLDSRQTADGCRPGDSGSRCQRGGQSISGIRCSR